MQMFSYLSFNLAATIASVIIQQMMWSVVLSVLYYMHAYHPWGSPDVYIVEALIDHCNMIMIAYTY